MQIKNIRAHVYLTCHPFIGSISVISVVLGRLQRQSRRIRPRKVKHRMKRAAQCLCTDVLNYYAIILLGVAVKENPFEEKPTTIASECLRDRTNVNHVNHILYFDWLFEKCEFICCNMNQI